MNKLPDFLRRHSHWLYPLIGLLCGLLYVLLDEGILDQLGDSATALLIAHEFLDAIFPVLLGLSVGYGVHLLKRRQRLNERLSMRNERLRKDLVSSTLISQILHEIRNPLHNVSAALEEELETPDSEKLLVVKRNLEKIDRLKRQYASWSQAFDAVDPQEATDLEAWFDGFAEDRLRGLLQEHGVRLEKEIEPMRVRFHSLLLEQAALSLFGNALEALSSQEASGRRLHFTAETLPSDRSKAQLKIKNRGAFPDEALQSQGRRPLPSRRGMGLGLVLVRKMVEQAGGELVLSNEQGFAVVTITLHKDPA